MRLATQPADCYWKANMAALSYGNVMAVIDVASVRTLARQTAGTPYNVVSKIITTANSAAVFNQNLAVAGSSVGSNVFITYTSIDLSQLSTQKNTSNIGKVRYYYSDTLSYTSNTGLGSRDFGNTSVTEIFGNIYQSTAGYLNLTSFTANLGKVRTYYSDTLLHTSNTGLGSWNYGNILTTEIFGNIYQSLAQSYTTTGIYVVGKGGLAVISTGGGGGGLTGKIESWT